MKLTDVRSELKKLTADNRKTIRKIRVYLESRHLNEFVFYETYSDIVGMALEYQERGQDFSEAVGMNYRDFCRSLIKSAQRQTWAERFLDDIQWIWRCGFFLIPMLYLFVLLFEDWSPARHEGAVLIAPVSYVVKYCALAMIVIVGWYLVKRAVYTSPKITFGLYLSSILLGFLLMDNLQRRFVDSSPWRIHVLVWMACALLLLVASKLAKRLVAKSVALYRGIKKNK
ncbi:MAG: hypothetical protein WDA00_01930 [Eubacteriales bacterium]